MGVGVGAALKFFAITASMDKKVTWKILFSKGIFFQDTKKLTL